MLLKAVLQIAFIVFWIKETFLFAKQSREIIYFKNTEFCLLRSVLYSEKHNRLFSRLPTTIASRQISYKSVRALDIVVKQAD